MKNNSKYFCNRECEYYPCHKGMDDLNCLFCYCPMYHYKCPGNYRVFEANGKRLKDCMECTFPHIPEHYDAIMQVLYRAELFEG